MTTSADEPPRRIGRAAAWAAAAAVAAALSSVPAAAQPAAPAAVDPANAPLNVDQLVQQNLDQDNQTLLNGRNQAERDESARRLAARQSFLGRQGLQAALVPKPAPPQLTKEQLAKYVANQSAAQLAAARGVADDPSPSPQHVGPLGDLFGASRELSEAAAVALAAYRDEPAAAQASARLVQMIRGQGQPFWEAGVRAAGASVDKRVADALVQLVNDNRAPGGARDAAADALQEMTGLAKNGRDPAAWRQWWQNVAAPLNPAQFRAELFERGGGNGRRRRSAPIPGIDDVARRLFQLAAPANKADAMMQFLDAPEPAFRAAGVRLLLQVVGVGQAAPVGTLARVRELVRDSSPDVRSAAIQALGRLNDKASVAQLLAQLRIETEPAVRAIVADAVTTFQDTRTVPELLSLLQADPSAVVAQAAGRALAKLAPVIRRDARMTADVTARATQILNQNNAQPAGDVEGLRRAGCAELLAALLPRGQVQPAQLQPFANLLNANQPRALRQAAVTALGDIGDPQGAPAVVKALQVEPDADIRKYALAAIERIGSFNYAGTLLAYTTPAAEADAGVRARAGQAFVGLLPKASEKELTDQADLFRREPNYDRLLDVLRVLAVKQQERGAGEDLALTRDGIGAALVQLNRPAEAVSAYRAALDYWLANRGTEETIAALTRVLLGAQLAAKQYPEAAAFAKESIARDAKLTDRVLAPIANEAERLLDANQREAAQALSKAAMEVPAAAAPQSPYRGRLEKVARDSVQPGGGR